MVLRKRRSVRDFVDESLTRRQVAQLLWAAQGETDREGLRTAPSAGALYPLKTDLVVGDVRDLEAGIYRYRPRNHELRRIKKGDFRELLAELAAEQEWIADAPLVLAFSAVFGRTTKRYGREGKVYVHLEAGHATQNVSLQAVSLGLGSVMVGAFDARAVGKILRLGPREKLLCLQPVGRV
jgi:SagB-type dehydrogenase family enzyme